MFEQLKEMNAEMEALKAKHLERSKGSFTEVSQQLFNKHAVLQSFSWTQYTPYFNDGDECTFSAHIDEPKVNGLDPYDDNSSETVWQSRSGDKPGGYVPNPDFNPAIRDARVDVVEFLSNIDESVLRDMFGDHVEVKVTRDGTEVEEYEHD
jgi:hypothetical protein